MSCKFIKREGYNAFQCSRIGEFEYLKNGIFDPDKKDGDVYGRYECDHSDRSERRGILVCNRCGAIYNENKLSWE